MRKGRVSTAVILAAGDGDRLGHLTATCPKVLLPLRNQEPLISYPICALADAGIKEIAIVVGHLADKVIHSLGDGSRFGVELHYVVNSDYLGGNAISVWRAKEFAQGNAVVLCMGDHIIYGQLVRRLLEMQILNETLCVDYTPAKHHKIEEATKVTVDISGCIKNIDKELTYWDALDTGVFLITDNFFGAVDELIQSRGTDVAITDAINFLVDKGHYFHTCDVSGCFWIDMDTKEELIMARSM